MRKVIRALAVLVGMSVVLLGSAAHAGSIHFVGDVSVTRTGTSLTVSGKVAGLGNEAQIHVSVTATAACINPGSNKPKAANKQSISAGGDFPVQNGKALFELTATATFQPDCTPPMTVVFSDVVVTVDGTGLSVTIPGPL